VVHFLVVDISVISVLLVLVGISDCPHCYFASILRSTNNPNIRLVLTQFSNNVRADEIGWFELLFLWIFVVVVAAIAHLFILFWSSTTCRTANQLNFFLNVDLIVQVKVCHPI
jgi:hypothetical protein